MDMIALYRLQVFLATLAALLGAQALRVPAGQSWSIIPANSPHWLANPQDLDVADLGTQHAMESTFTGPGVATLFCDARYGLVGMNFATVSKVS
jgi:hypothetical protein